MKQLFYIYPQQGIKMMDVPEPQITGPGEVKVRLQYAAICGSDAHTASGGNDGLYASFGIPEGVPLPMGHESTGVVTEVGAEVTVVKPGDRVAINAVIPCRKCHSCRNGHENLCEAPQSGKVSGMAEYIVLPETEVFLLPEDLSARSCCLAEPLHIAMESIEKAAVKPGESVAIIGGGPIGMLAMQVAKLQGAYPVVLFDVFEEKLAIGRELGADAALDSRQPNALEQALAYTNGRGFNHVIECAGSPKVLDMAVALLARAGKLIITAVYSPGQKYDLDMGVVFTKELDIRASYIAPNTFERALNLLHRIDCERTITSEFPFEQFEEAFQAHRSGKNIKVVMKISD